MAESFKRKLQILENKTNIIDNLSPAAQMNLIAEAQTLHDLSMSLSTGSQSAEGLAACIDASEALINFIKAEIAVNRHVKQDWEDYTQNKLACFSAL